MNPGVGAPPDCMTRVQPAMLTRVNWAKENASRTSFALKCTGKAVAIPTGRCCMWMPSWVFVWMQEWKNKNGLTTCLQTPQPHYDVIKKAIFHGVICFSKTDHPVRIMKVLSCLGFPCPPMPSLPAHCRRAQQLWQRYCECQAHSNRHCIWTLLVLPTTLFWACLSAAGHLRNILSVPGAAHDAVRCPSMPVPDLSAQMTCLSA